jgi:NAD(P)H-nitrite reductase
MLPDYISGAQSWEQLIKMKEEEEPGYHIHLYRGVSVVSIDRENKCVTDSNGRITYYDILILTTGSRAAIPRNVPPLEGIFTMRSRTDADHFKNHVPKDGHVVIVGGGLLGLELAASLRARENLIIQPVTELLKVPDFELPYYEGFNRYGEKSWLGIYRRDECFPVLFLKILQHFACAPSWDRCILLPGNRW